MNNTPITSTGPVLLLGGGPIDLADVVILLEKSEGTVAADSGADWARRNTIAVEWIIGDLDSLDDRTYWQDRNVTITEVNCQDTTDFEKCLGHVSAPLYLGCGFLGGWLDHTLAVLNAIAKNPHKRIVLVGPEEVCFHCTAQLGLQLPIGTRFSLFPMSPTRGMASSGLKWSVDGLDFAPSARIGTSNQTISPTVRIGFDRPGMLVMVPKTLLSRLLPQLCGD
jgi:thiamine pyrophosphokinase